MKNVILIALASLMLFGCDLSRSESIQPFASVSSCLEGEFQGLEGNYLIIDAGNVFLITVADEDLQGVEDIIGTEQYYGKPVSLSVIGSGDDLLYAGGLE